jgi:hypothetical protein
VLAGVVQLDWAIRFGRERFALQGAVTKLEAVKFQRLFRPPGVLVLALDWHAERARLDFRATSAQGTHASGRVFLDAAPTAG